MKKYIIGGLVVSSLLLSGCMDGFLERNPFGQIDETTFFFEEEHANLAAIAAYSKLQKLNKHWADAQLELGMTGDFSDTGFKELQPFIGASFNPNESNIVLGVWKSAYDGIAICNKGIEGVTGMSDKDISTEKRELYLAELRFVRAFWYFRLIQFYGDVPMRTSSVENPSDAGQVQMPATSKDKILKDLILPDLEFASTKLPQKWDDANYTRATRGAAWAYLCEVYLYMNDYDKAITAGGEVEKLGYQLIDNPGNVLRVDYENSSELIFTVGFGNGASTYRDFYFGTIEDLGEDGRIMRGDSYSGDYIYPSKDFIDFFQTIDGKSIKGNSPYYDASVAWKNRDPRFDATFFTTMDEIKTTKNKVFNWKNEWLVNTSTGYDIQKRGVWYGDDNWNMQADIHLMRLPRVYLHMAEAYAKKATPDFEKCASYVEKVRSRARQFALANRAKYVPQGLADKDVLPAFPITNIDQAMSAINYESRVEFFTEDCIRYFDLKRWGKLADEWAREGQFTWSDKFYNLPIPASELTANKSLKQNHPAWGN